MIIRDIIIIAAVIGVMVLGFFVMRRLDRFLGENRKRIEQEEKEKETSRTVLTTRLSDEELIKRIRTYEEEHGEAKITLDRDEDDPNDELFDGKR